MTSRRFNASDADKELAELRKLKPVVSALNEDIPISGASTIGGPSSSASGGAVGLLRRKSSASAPTTANSSSSAASSALYNLLLRDDFRPSDAQPILSKSLAVQVKELRRMESAVLEDTEEIDTYRYDEEGALRDKLMGLDTVLQTGGPTPTMGGGGLLPRRKEMRDDASGGGVSGVGEPQPNHSAPTPSSLTTVKGPSVDEDGNMCCGTDDLEDFIRQQQERREGTTMGNSRSNAAVVKTVSEVPRSIAEMALGAPLEALIDSIAKTRSVPLRPTSSAGSGRLIATSARGPPVAVFQSILSEQPSSSSAAAAGSGSRTSIAPSPPRIGKPPSSTALLMSSSKAGATRTASSASGAQRSASSTAAGFNHDIYSVSAKPSSSGGVGISASSSLRSGSIPRGSVKPPAAMILNKKQEEEEEEAAKKQQAQQKLFIHTEYLGKNTIAFCPNCRHCVDIAQLKLEQKVTATEDAVCPRCNEKWVDKTLLLEQKKIEDDEAEAFQKAVMEWRMANNKTNSATTKGTTDAHNAKNTNNNSGAEGGVGVGTDSKPLAKKGVKIPKGVYFQHLWKCLEQRQKEEGLV